MPAKDPNNGDYKSLAKTGRANPDERAGDLRSLRGKTESSTPREHEAGLANIKPPVKDESGNDEVDKKLPVKEAFALRPKDSDRKSPSSENFYSKILPDPNEEFGNIPDHIKELNRKKREKRADRDFEMLNRDSWVTRNGHYLTYIGLYCFSILVLYRPYELVPAFGFLSATAFYVAIATLAIFIPAQLATEGTLSYLSFEVKMVIALTAIALISVPIARSPRTAWAEFNEIFIKAVLMFIVMVNVLRTRRRLMGMIWLSLGIGLVLSVMAIQLYWTGELTVEGYRVGVKIGGLFGNPNDLALHLVMMAPLSIALGLASKDRLKQLGYFAMSALFVAGIMVTYSRGGFLGMVCVAGFLVWKLGKEQRIQVLAVSAVLLLVIILFAPGNYGMRLLSIFDPSLDGVGSRNQRRDLLFRSLLVSARNPWGIGIGNFPIVGIRNLVSHNSYTQVSSELGVAGLASYLLFVVSPFRKLAAIERRLEDDKNNRWFYFLAIGLQASLLGFLVSSFFVSVAYNWFIYYLVAYAVAFRRIYTIEFGIEERAKKFSFKNFIPGLHPKQ